MPSACSDRSAYLLACFGRTIAPTTSGFSRGLTSIARPYACCDQTLEPRTSRQLNADVLSMAIERPSLPPNAWTGIMRRIG